MSTSKLAKLRKLAIRGAAAAAVALPLTLVPTPAEAAFLNGCTVTPLAPVRVGATAFFRFPTRISCVANRIVRVVDQRYEADAPAGILLDDPYGSTTYLRTFPAAATIIVSTTDLVTNTEPGREEVYHRTNMRVASINVIMSRGFQNSAVVSVNI